MSASGGPCTYDEDIAENPFFKNLCEKFPDAYNKAVSDGWIICIPRTGSYFASDLTEDDILSHVLVPSTEDVSLFHTITNKTIIKKENTYVVQDSESSRARSVRIMFSETCYSEDLSKHIICCLEGPLCLSGCAHVLKPVHPHILTGMHDCLSFLWTAGNGHLAINAVNKCCGIFVESDQNLKAMTVDKLQEKVYQLYNKALKLYCDKGGVEERFHGDALFAQTVQLALETYILYLLSHNLMEGLLAATAAEDAGLNKTIQNLQEIQPEDVGIRSQFWPNLVPARQQMLRLPRQQHPLGKYLTLRRVARELDAADASLSSDDLLPCFVFLVLKTSLCNWMAQLNLLKKFHFSASSANTSEYGFLVATLEAALEHVRSGALVCKSPQHGQRVGSFGSSDEQDDVPEEASSAAKASNSHAVLTNPERSELPGTAATTGSPSHHIVAVQELLAAISSDDVHHLESLLEEHEYGTADSTITLCHPLCSCERCRPVGAAASMGPAVGMLSVDGDGRTPLHVAAAHSAVRCLEALVARGARLDARDRAGLTPLHAAVGRGHQGAALLLLHLGASPSRRCRRGNTPLHTAANNAHTACVQALLYHAEQTGAPAGVGAANREGDTPLHLAARWGYVRIAELLAAHGAQSDVLNRRRQTPADTAHDHVVRQRLLAACERYRRSAPRALVRLLRGTPVPPPPQLPKSQAAGTGSRATRRLFAAIAAGDERLACFHLGLNTRDPGGSLQALCHPLCACARCTRLAAQRSSSPLSVGTRDEAGRTPLHAAMSARQLDLSRLLVDAGADINAVAADGSTPLHCACAAEFAAGAAELLGRGADVGCVDAAGRTALHVACGRQHAELCRRLLRAGADRAARCGRGRLPLEHAGAGRAALGRVFAEVAGGCSR